MQIMQLSINSKMFQAQASSFCEDTKETTVMCSVHKPQTRDYFLIPHSQML